MIESCWCFLLVGSDAYVFTFCECLIPVALCCFYQKLWVKNS